MSVDAMRKRFNRLRRNRNQERKKGRILGKRTLVGTLTKNYILFSLVVIVIVIAVYIYAIFSSANITATDEFFRIAEYKSEMERGLYDEIPLKKIMGKTSFFQIVDEDGRVIHTQLASEAGSDIRKLTSYTKRQMDCISDFNEFIIMDENDKGTLFTKKFAKDNKLVYEGSLRIDKNRNILYSDYPIMTGKLSPSEYFLLSSYVPETHTVKKIKFKSDDGRNLYLVVYAKVTKINHYARIAVHMMEALVLSFLFYIVMVIMFVIWTKRKIQKPMKVLERGLERFTKEDVFEPINYQGLYELEEICETFNKMGEDISVADEQRAEMIADIAHDLKTPLTVLNGYTKALSDGMVAKDKIPKYLSLIEEKNEVVVSLIENFHNYSMMKRTDFAFKMEKIEICEFIRSYFAEAYQDLMSAGYDLSADIPEDKIYINGDKVQLKRLFGNFVSNTVKHNEKGTTFKVRLKKLDGFVEIVVGDDGKGISEADAQKIFQPFYTGYEAREKPNSSGLGMSIVKSVVEGHGGKIIMKRPSDQGFSIQFIIRFPLVQE